MVNKEQDRRLQEALLYYNRLQSENNDGAENDLEPAQEKLYQLLKRMNLEKGLVRLAVDTHPNVRKMRNRLDNQSNYGDETVKRSERALRMRPDVLCLMDLRNEAAKEIGYCDYVSAILKAEDLDVEEVMKQLTLYLNQHLSSVTLKVKEKDISIRDWYEWQHSKVISEICQPSPLLESFAERLHLKAVLSDLEIHIKDSFCFASQIDENRILIQLSPIKTVGNWCTMFHEFGHACVYKKLPENALPRLSSLMDEVIAVLFENAAIRLLLDEPLQRQALDYLHTEYTRTCISALFELDLWNHPSQPEELYEKWYHRLGVKVYRQDWALDSFRSIDCMSVFAYTLGQIIADSLTDEKLVDFLLILIEKATDLTLKQVLIEMQAEIM